MMRRIINDTGSSQYRAFLSGDSNFRKSLSPEYKANRKDKVRPQYLERCREFLVTEWGATLTDGCEADDELGSRQNDGTIICTIDKDLRQIPGQHYNFVKGEFFSVTEIEGLAYFYKQLLIGDSIDNIFGVKGIGKVKADKIIHQDMKEEEMFNVVRELYKDDARLILNGKLLHIWRFHGDIWECPFLQKQEAEAPSAILGPQDTG